MPVLNWIGKESVVNHDKEVPFRLLKKVKSISVGENSQNLIIRGDNLEGLKALMPYYQGKIKCIYIDPPYNTGYEGWVYSDSVNSPKIKKWLEQKTQVKADDLTRHDKWLCMMYPRLKLLRDLLSNDGIIFVNIDDNEASNLRMIMDEIFGEQNFRITFIWKKKSTSTNVEGAQISSLTDYIITYGKTAEAKIKQRIRLKETRSYPFKDKEGKYRLAIIEKKHAGSYKRDSMLFPILGKVPRKGKRWQIGEDTARELERKNRFVLDNGIVKHKIYDFEDKDTYSAQPNLIEDYGTTDTAAKELQELFGEKEIFDNPKPVELIKYLVSISCDSKDIVLDSFAGSGTTGHAVMESNKDNRTEMKFILVQIHEDINEKAEAYKLGYKTIIEITKERIIKAIKKFDYNEGFEFCELDKPLFNENGQIEPECTFEQLATYIYFTETNTNINKKMISENLIGAYNETNYYLIFKEKGKNILNKSFLKKIQKNAEKSVVYADKCLIDKDELDKFNIGFKQIPYEIKVY